MMNIALPEYGKVVQLQAPISYAGAGTSDSVSLKNCQKAYFVVQFNCLGNAATITITLWGGPTVATATNACALGNWWYQEGSAAAMLLTDTAIKGAVAAANYTPTTVTEGYMIIEINPEDFVTLGYDCFSVRFSACDATQHVSAMAYLIPGRYQQAVPPSAIID